MISDFANGKSTIWGRFDIFWGRLKQIQDKWDYTFHTLWLFNIAMENGPFIDEFPIKTSIYKGFSMAMLNKQMVNRVTY